MTEIETLVRTLRLVIDQNKKNEEAVKELTGSITEVIQQQAAIISQLNKHSNFIVQHERLLARCMSCVNYAPRAIDRHAQTTTIQGRSKRSSPLKIPK